MVATLEALLRRARATRWVNVSLVNLRILIGFAFVPSGLKKVLDQPFTDPRNAGPFHDFLDAFHATGGFYAFVGAMQLLAAVLLCTQRFATLGALAALPILTAITVFCWSTQVVPTAIVATLMLLGTVALVVWDYPKWRGVLARDDRALVLPPIELAAPIDLRLWQWCGAAVLAVYGAVCALQGGIYRPRGVELDNPAFYLFPAIGVIPVLTFVIDQRRQRR